jgi:hypothetical protein
MLKYMILILLLTSCIPMSTQLKTTYDCSKVPSEEMTRLMDLCLGKDTFSNCKEEVKDILCDEISNFSDSKGFKAD